MFLLKHSPKKYGGCFNMVFQRLAIEISGSWLSVFLSSELAFVNGQANDANGSAYSGVTVPSGMTRILSKIAWLNAFFILSGSSQ
jgi:hypothetical protein